MLFASKIVDAQNGASPVPIFRGKDPKWRQFGSDPDKGRSGGCRVVNPAPALRCASGRSRLVGPVAVLAGATKRQERNAKPIGGRLCTKLQHCIMQPRSKNGHGDAVPVFGDPNLHFTFKPCRRKKNARASRTRLPGAWPEKFGMSMPSTPARPVSSMAAAMM